MSGAFARDARRYHATGVNVLPIVLGTKQVPAGVAWRQWQVRPQSKAELLQLIEAYRDSDVALLCGGPGCLVDLETDEPGGERALRELGLPVPATACFCSPRGVHRLYRAPSPIASRVGLRRGLDVLAARRYVVVPHSRGRNWDTPSGFADLAPLPAAWVDFLSRTAAARNPSSLQAAEALGVEEGSRNDTLARLAGRWCTRGVSVGEMMNRAEDFALRCRARTHAFTAEEAKRVVASVVEARARTRSAEGAALALGRNLALTATERLVLTGLAYLSGELGRSEGEQFAAPTRMVADITGVSRGAVSNAYHRLHEAGAVRLEDGRTPDGRHVALVRLSVRSPGGHKHL